MENKLLDNFKQSNVAQFQTFVTNYDQEVSASMRRQGFEYVNSSTRTVAFTFGEVTYSRKRWRKGENGVIPVDEKLGLKPYERYSPELMYQISELSNRMSYRKVVEVVEMMYQVVITKDTVLKAIKLTAQLLKEREDYRYAFEEIEQPKKINADVIYIEGDGLSIRVGQEGSSQSSYIQISHFVIHTGRQQLGPHRYELTNKKTIVARKVSEAKSQVIDYLYNHFEIGPDTLIVTNSDGGAGYTPYVFKEIAKSTPSKRHEHFYDQFHINEYINRYFRNLPNELRTQAYQAIYEHKRKDLEVVFDTAEAYLVEESKYASFVDFKNRLLKQFQYTKPPHLRGFKHLTIGVMESQHRRLSYRMKNGGKTWTIEGAETMAKMLILSKEDKLRDLFFGDWRQDYQHYQEIDLSADNFLPKPQSKRYDHSKKCHLKRSAYL